MGDGVAFDSRRLRTSSRAAGRSAFAGVRTAWL